MRLAAPLTAAILLAAARPVFADALVVTKEATKGASPSPAGVALEEPVPGFEDSGTGFLERFVLDSGRLELKPADSQSLSFAAHGEYQLRFQGQSTLALQPPIGQPRTSTLGQNEYLYHWLRIGARFDIFGTVAVVLQIDVPRGMIVGQTTEDVQAARDSFSQAQWYGVYPRYLYVEVNSPVGVFRVGQQGAQWGMGLVANDGDQVSLFGDHRRGALVERVLYATTPLGKGTPLVLALGGDLVFQDETADLLGGDRALQVFGVVAYRTKSAEIGVYGVGRHQTRSGQAVDQYTPFGESLTVGVVDVAGRFDVPVPGSDAFAYGEVEAAAIFGSTSYVRGAYGANVDPTAPRSDELIRTYGGAATLGVVKVAGSGQDRFGQVMGEVELGYASGDADPSDGVTKRFTFDENHHVGLVLFDQVLRWKTARSATLAQDPSIVARAQPGLEFLPSNGGVFGAQYINPRFVVRPRPWLDLKGGAVIAQTTADFVDPYQFGALGNARNYDGGDPHAHDLGVELDAGVAARFKVDRVAVVQTGFEGGVLFPGHAFDDASGHRLDNQYLGTLQLGLQF
jgi:hypothetical protein